MIADDASADSGKATWPAFPGERPAKPLSARVSPYDATFFEVMDAADYGNTDSESKATWPSLQQVRVPDARWCNRARIAVILQLILCIFVALSPRVKTFDSQTFNVGDYMMSVQQSATSSIYDEPIFCHAYTEGHNSLFKQGVPYLGGFHSIRGSMTPQQGGSMMPQQLRSMTPQQGGSTSDATADLNPPGD